MIDEEIAGFFTSVRPHARQQGLPERVPGAVPQSPGLRLPDDTRQRRRKLWENIKTNFFMMTDNKRKMPSECRKISGK